MRGRSATIRLVTFLLVVRQNRGVEKRWSFQRRVGDDVLESGRGREHWRRRNVAKFALTTIRSQYSSSRSL